MKQKKLIQTNPELLRWYSLFLRIECAYDNLRRSFEATPESEVPSAMYDTLTEYTKLLAAKLGDTDGWLDWYLLENGAGEKGLKAKASKWKSERPIKTLFDLQELIEGCKP